MLRGGTAASNSPLKTATCSTESFWWVECPAGCEEDLWLRDDAEGPCFIRFGITALLEWPSEQPAESPSLPFTVTEVMTVLVGPTTIALVVDLLQTPPRFLQSGDEDGIPLGSRKTLVAVSISFMEGKLVSMRAAGGSWSCSSYGCPSLRPSSAFSCVRCKGSDRSLLR